MIAELLASRLPVLIVRRASGLLIVSTSMAGKICCKEQVECMRANQVAKMQVEWVANQMSRVQAKCKFEVKRL